MSGQSNELRELLALRGERLTPNDCPRIGDFDALLEALRLHHGPEGRPDLQPIPHTTSTPEPVSGMAEPVQVAQRPARPQYRGCDGAEVNLMRMCRRPDGHGMEFLRGLRRDRLKTAQDRRRICDHARDYRLGLAVGRTALRRAS